MLTTPTLSPVYAAFVQSQRKIAAHVQAKFPGLCRGHVEDAVGAVALALVTNPAYYMRAYDPKNPARLLGLFKCVAQRAARGTTRRRSFSAERAFEHEDDVLLGHDGAQYTILALRRDLDRVIQLAAKKTSEPQAEGVEAAIREKLITGATDSEVAEQYDVRREYVNRGSNHVAVHFVGEAPRRRPQKTV